MFTSHLFKFIIHVAVSGCSLHLFLSQSITLRNKATPFILICVEYTLSILCVSVCIRWCGVPPWWESTPGVYHEWRWSHLYGELGQHQEYVLELRTGNSLSLSHTHTHTHTICCVCVCLSGWWMACVNCHSRVTAETWGLRLHQEICLLNGGNFWTGGVRM